MKPSHLRYSPTTAALATAFTIACLLTGCVAAPPAADAPQPARPLAVEGPGYDPRVQTEQRFTQVESRIERMGRRIDLDITRGRLAPGAAAAYHDRLRAIDQQAHDYASTQGGGLSRRQQGRLNDELDNLTATGQ